MAEEFSPFAINVNDIATEEQVQEGTQVEEVVKTSTPILDLPTFDNNVEEPAFETVEVKKREKVTPQQQAEALMNNYLTTHPNLFLSGKQRRNIYREFLRNAEKGRYEKIFNADI